MPDYYQILGVPRDATQAQIKAAFKKLALLYHPDRNPNDASAESKFKQINEAHQVLTDPVKKERYDLGQSDYVSPGPPPTYQYQRPHSRSRSRYSRPYGGAYRPKAPAMAPDMASKVHLAAIVSFVAVAILAVILYHLLNHYASEKNYQEAMQHYRQGDYQQALYKVQEACFQDDENPQALILKGTLLQDYKKEHRQATWAFNKALLHSEELQAEGEGLRRILSDIHLRRGKSYYALAEYLDALRDFEQAVDFWPDNSQAWYYLAEARLYKTLNYDIALKAYEKVLTYQDIADSIRENSRLGHAIANFKLRNYTSSTAELQQILEKDPLQGVAYFYLARNYLDSSRDTVNACIGFKNALELGVREARPFIKRCCQP